MSLARDPLALARISRATGLNIVMGAGYYVAAAHPVDMDRRSEDSIAREIVQDHLSERGDVRDGAEQARMPGDAIHGPGVVIVDLAWDRRMRCEGLPEPLRPRGGVARTGAPRRSERETARRPRAPSG